MSMQRRILALTDLLLGAAHADSRFDGREEATVRALLDELFIDDLPDYVTDRIATFTMGDLDLAETVKEFAESKDSMKERVLNLVASVHRADEVVSLEEDAYLHRLGQALGLPEAVYRHLRIQSMETLRSDFSGVTRIGYE